MSFRKQCVYFVSFCCSSTPLCHSYKFCVEFLNFCTLRSTCSEEIRWIRERLSADPRIPQNFVATLPFHDPAQRQRQIQHQQPRTAAMPSKCGNVISRIGFPHFCVLQTVFLPRQISKSIRRPWQFSSCCSFPMYSQRHLMALAVPLPLPHRLLRNLFRFPQTFRPPRLRLPRPCTRRSRLWPRQTPRKYHSMMLRTRHQLPLL
jgi:hypothetical protein